MKTYLPKTSNNPEGFTLIELMVVIAIIAILSVVGLTIFQGTQRSARDSRRRQEVQAISKALEQAYNPNTGQYQVLANGMFAANVIPTDPQTGQSVCGAGGALPCIYCANAGAVPIACNGAAAVSAAAPAAGPSFNICTNLETAFAGTQIFCVPSSR